MRLRSIMTPFALVVASYAVVRNRRKQRAMRHAIRDDFASDPRDPVQGFDEASELQVTPLDVDALSQGDVEAAQDLAGLEAELDERPGIAGDDEVIELDRRVQRDVRERDAGELYGAHTPAAVDRKHPDDDRAFAEGQNWIEALETSAIENGAEPERTLDDIVDDQDVLRPPHASDTRDRPIADFGSGGRRGL
jgi:hypothetical protein